MTELEAKEQSNVILVESGYGILRIPMNFVVARLKNVVPDVQEARREDFDEYSYEYYSNLSGALIGLSNDLLEGKLKRSCKDRALSVKELANILKEHHEYMKAVLERGL